MSADDLVTESQRATSLLKRRAVSAIKRERGNDLLVEFEDGVRLYIDSKAPLELSITNVELRL